MDLPDKISPCPIQEVTFEIRFFPKVPREAVFGMLHQKFISEFKFDELEQLPISKVPSDILKNQKLIFQPYFRLRNENIVLQIGPQVFSIGQTGSYSGWNNFSSKLVKSIKLFNEINVTDKLVRFGLRYINSFDSDIFVDKLNLALLVDKKNNFECENLAILAEKVTGDFKTVIRLSNKSRINIGDKTRSVSIIDLDTYKDENLKDIFNDTKCFLDKAHTEEKKLFFSLLKKEFVKELMEKERK